MPSSIAKMWMPPLKRLCCPAEQRRADDGRDELEPSKQNGLRTPRIGTALLAAVLLAAAAAYTVTRSADAVSGLDDHGRLFLDAVLYHPRALQAAHSMARLMRW